MNDLNFNLDPEFASFINMVNAVRGNNFDALEQTIGGVQRMEKSEAAFAVGLLNTPDTVDPRIVALLADNALAVHEQHKDFDTVNYCVSRAGVRFAEQSNVEALQTYLPKLKQFKERVDRELEEDLYLDVAVEKQSAEVLEYIVSMQQQHGNFGGLGLVSVALMAHKRNDPWALERLLELENQYNWGAEKWHLVALGLQQEEQHQWVRTIVERFGGDAAFESNLENAVTEQASNDLKTMVQNFRIRRELDIMQDQARANKKI